MFFKTSNFSRFQGNVTTIDGFNELKWLKVLSGIGGETRSGFSSMLPCVMAWPCDEGDLCLEDPCTFCQLR